MEHSPGQIISWVTNQALVNKKIEILSSIISDHKDQISIPGKKSVKNTNTYRLKNTLLNNQDITEEIKKYLETNDNENTMTENLWDAAKQF